MTTRLLARSAGWYLVLTALGALFSLPLLWMLSSSLHDLAGVFAQPFRWLPSPPRWDNYLRAVTLFPFGGYLVNTVVITASTVVLTLASSALAAYGFARMRFRGRDALFAVCLATMMLPGQVTFIPLYMLFARLGFIDTWLPLILPAAFGSPFYIFLLRQFFRSIPRELDDAARIDGAGTLRVFWSIVLPQARPALATVAVFSFIGAWNDFFGPLVYINSPERATLTLGLNMMKSQVLGSGVVEWQLLMAASLLVLLPNIVVFLLAQKHFIKGISMGALRVAVILVPAALALACGRGGGAAEVTYNCAANTRDIEALEREKATLRDATGIELRLLPFSGDDKLIAMVAAGQAPDIFYVNSVMRDRLAAEGKLLDLRPLAARDGFLARLRPGFLAHAYAADSGLYSIPNWSFSVGVYYNRAAFDEARLPYPDTSWTWDRMAGVARRLVRDADGDGVPERYGISIGSHFIEALEIMNHAPIAWNAAALDIPPESRAVYAAWRALVASGVMPDGRRVQALGMQAPQLLESGRVAMLVEAVPHPALFETLHIPWGVAPLPRFEAKSPRCFRAESGGLAISASARDPRRAWEALKWLVSSASIYQPNPVLAGVNAADGWERRYPALRGSGFRETTDWNERYGYGDYRYFVRFSSWTMNPIMQRLQPLLDRVWAGAMTPDELAAAVPGINAAVREDLAAQLRSATLRPAFRARLEQQYRTMR